jgi:adenylate cyclase
MIDKLKTLLFEPAARYPESWAPAFVALQIGFVAGAVGLLGRDALFYGLIDNWRLATAIDLGFAAIVGVGFVLHTLGWAQLGVIVSCLGGVGAASALIILFGWDPFFHLWYINLAILLIAVPIRTVVKVGLALSFTALYCFMFIYVADRTPVLEISPITVNILGVSNIVGSLLILGLPMGMYAIELAKEREKSERLLHNIMPKEIADQLKETGDLIAMDNPEVSVLIADIVSFTALAENTAANQLVGLLNDLFSRFDDLSEQQGVEKIKTMGDAYMIVAGLPRPRDDHAEVLAKMSIEMLKIAGEYTDHEGNPIRLRIGLHSGSAISGVIGKSKFAFDLWGDTVNTAARLESHGEPGRVHVSDKTRDLIKGKMSLCAPRTVDLKGKGKMETYLLKPVLKR